MGTVAALHRYPVKSMLGEALTDVRITAAGLSGDRMFGVLDGAGAVGSAKHPRKWEPLLRCRKPAVRPRRGPGGAARRRRPGRRVGGAGRAAVRSAGPPGLRVGQPAGDRDP